MVGKRRSMTKKASAVPAAKGDSLVCIFCRDRVAFNGSLPATDYEIHLESKHGIQYELEMVINRTLLLQRPNMLMEQRIDAQVQTDIKTSRDIPSNNVIVNLRRLDTTDVKTIKVKKEAKSPEPVASAPPAPASKKPKIKYKLIEVTEKRRIPWFAGCEYQCKYDDCGEMYFYNEDLRTHIKKEHGDPDEYLDKFDNFETQEDHIACKECFLNIKRHFSSVFLHLRDVHNNMTLHDYAKKHKMKDYDKSVKVKKKIKEEPIDDTEIPEKKTVSPALTRKRQRSATSSPMPPPVSVSPLPLVAPLTRKRPRSETSSPKPTTSNAVAHEPALTRKRPSRNSTPKPSSSVSSPKVIKIEKPTLKVAVKTEDNNGHPTPAIKEKNRPKIDKPWYSGCEYACKICGVMHYSLNELLYHVRTTHDMTGKPYQRQFSKFETKKYFYECKLCFTKIKHNKAAIQSHLSAQHESMKLEAYEEVFHPNLSNGNAPKSLVQASVTDDKFKTWAKGTCLFKCKICLYTTGGSVDFWKHVKASHSVDIQMYKDKWGNPCVVMNKITCPDCSRVLRYDYGTLLGHASTKHSMNLLQFYNKFFRTAVEQGSTLKLGKATSLSEAESKKDGRLFKNKGKPGSLKHRAHTWGWRCRYRCAICTRNFSSRVGIQKHVNLSHGLCLKEYNAKHGSVMVKKVIHQCLICQAHILHDPSVIAMHTRNQHKLNYEAYYSQYICHELSTGTGKQISSVAAGKTITTAKRKSMILLKKAKSQYPPREHGRGEHAKWAHNAADYKCKVCGFTSTVKNTFLFHISSKHELPAMAYKAQFGPLSEFERKHQCKICNAKIAWHAMNIGQHLNSLHKMTLKDYYYKYIKGKPQPKVSVVAPTRKVKPRVVPPQPPKQDDLILDPSRWMNRCIFECKLCFLKLDSRAHFKSHVNNLHNAPYDKYVLDYGEPMIVMNLHCCLMCQESVTCDGEDISDHLNTAHALSLEDYHDRYIANDRMVATVKKPNPLCRNWNQQANIHTCLICSEQVQFAKDVLEVHMKSHGIDLRVYEKRFRHQLDVIFEAFNEIPYENGEQDQNDDSDFGSVFEEEDDEELVSVEMDPLHDAGTANGIEDDNFIQSADDIDDIDIEENVDYITDEVSLSE